MTRAPSRAGLSVDGTGRLGSFVLDVTVHAAPGEVVAVVGPNGAGKSTLLRVVAGLVPLDGGAVRLGDTAWDEPASHTFTPPERRGAALVFADHLLFGHLTALDNVAFGLRARGVPRGSARATAADWLARMGLADLAHRRPGELSGGQAQRVGLARALATDPPVLLLDEPMAALDATTRGQVRGTLHEHLAARPGPTLLVTHDPADAAVLADRVLVLEGGRVGQVGTPAQVAQAPASSWTATLLGGVSP